VTASRGPDALNISGLTVSYGGPPVVWDVTARFPQGLMSAIVGPNGSGKSTLLRATMGIQPVDSGRVEVLGMPPARARQQVAYVPQRDEVDWDFPITVREAVEMGRYPARGWFRRLTPADRAAARVAIERLGLAPYASRQVGELSGGQRQRVFLARALCQEPRLLVLDEPFAGIDARTERDLLQLLSELVRTTGASVVAVHHDLATLRAAFDWALLVNVRGIACGPVADALSPANVARAYGSDSVLEPAP
jgi:manganese/zinc/iron transport system ATP- binding protein